MVSVLGAVRRGALGMLLLAAALPAFAAKPAHYVLGDVSARTPGKVEPGLLLMGGGDRNFEAMRWFMKKAGNGHIVVLRASQAGEIGEGVDGRTVAGCLRHRLVDQRHLFHGGVQFGIRLPQGACGIAKSGLPADAGQRQVFDVVGQESLVLFALPHGGVIGPFQLVVCGAAVALQQQQAQGHRLRPQVAFDLETQRVVIHLAMADAGFDPQGVAQDASRSAYVSATVGMLHGLGLHVRRWMHQQTKAPTRITAHATLLLHKSAAETIISTTEIKIGIVFMTPQIGPPKFRSWV